MAHQEIYEHELNEKQSELDKISNELDKQEEVVTRNQTKLNKLLPNINFLENKNFELK